MRTLVTGSSGFVGTHILSAVSDCYPLDCKEGVDLLDMSMLEQSIGVIKPDFVIHLAAQSHIPTAFANPMATYDVNFKGTYNLLHALQRNGFQGRFLYVSSGDVYGQVGYENLPITEDVLPKPGNPYAVSKVAAEALCYQQSLINNFDIIIARPFNHIGPGQAEYFVIADFAKQIAEIKLSLRESVIWVGDVEVTRDFTDVRDVIRAYFLLLQKGESGELYNVCSGQERSVYSLLVNLIGLSQLDIKIECDNSRLRQIDQRRVVASSKKINTVTSWQPQIDINETLSDILNYWLEKLL